MKKVILKNGWRLKRVVLSELAEETLFSHCQADAYAVKAMPMEVADVLLDLGVIDEPWKPGLCMQYQWIGESDWVYTKTFDLPDLGGTWRLNCDGLDLFADIYINDIKVASHANTLYPLNTVLPDVLRPGKTNTIAVVLMSTSNRILSLTPEMGDASLQKRAQALNLRKNLNDFIGYLGAKPYFIRMGIFADVCLVNEGDGLLEESILDAQVNQAMDIGFLKITCKGMQSGEGFIRVTVIGPLGDRIEREYLISGEKFALQETINIAYPHLWYPVGYGDQPIYAATVALVVSGQVVDSITRKTGFRKLEMPTPLHFRINGKDVRLYGGNWAPHSAVTECWDQERAEQMLDIAVQGNYNTLRVWGCDSTIPEGFYEYADKLGIVIWNDFCNINTSGMEKDRQNNLMEAEYMVKRLLHHPAIVIWCGGNESLSFYHWSHNGEKMPGREVLELELRRLCDRLDPSRPYIPESPYGGNDYNDPRVWDTHCYTNYSFVPGYDYLNFATEDFRISAPSLKTCRRFMQEDQIWPADYAQVHKPGDLCEVPPTWLLHSGTAESDLKFGPLWDFYDAVDGESMIHRVGLAAGSFYRDTIERLRRGRPSGTSGHERCCGGYLAWKFNDSWPQIYGAKVDYFMEPFIPYYFMKRAYSPVQISFDINNFIHAWVVNDSPDLVSGALHVKLFNISKNNLTKEVTYHVSAMPGESVDIADLTEEFQTFRRQNILFAELVDNKGSIIARTTQIVGVERYIRFPKATLQLKVSGDTLSLTTDQYAHCVYLEGEDAGDAYGWQFEDNYFSLVPGETRQVIILGSHRSGTIKAKEFYSGIVSTIGYSAS